MRTASLMTTKARTRRIILPFRQARCNSPFSHRRSPPSSAPNIRPKASFKRKRTRCLLPIIEVKTNRGWESSWKTRAVDQVVRCNNRRERLTCRAAVSLNQMTVEAKSILMRPFKSTFSKSPSNKSHRHNEGLKTGMSQLKLHYRE